MNRHNQTLGDLQSVEQLEMSLRAAFGDQPLLHRELSERFSTLIQFHCAPSHGVSHMGSLPASDAMLLHVPGRIEVFGKHTDYAGGVSLTCASSRSLVSVVTSHSAPSLIVSDAIRGLMIELPYDNPLPVADQSWSTYLVAVLKRLIRHFGIPASGISMSLASNVPSASGMSSSSGLIIAVALALLGKGGFPFAGRAGFSFSRERFAGFAGALESGADFENLGGDLGVGTKGGSQDHAAILCSTASELGLYSYFPVKKETSVPFPKECVFVIASSGVKARKTGNAKEAYNDASFRASNVVSAWNVSELQHARTMGEMVLHPSFTRKKLRSVLSQSAAGARLWDRFSQFDRECHVVIPGALQALADQNWEALGRFTDESQKMADTWLGNQVAETNDLVRMARATGALGASAFGAGFGGAVWAVVRKNGVEAFMSEWMKKYVTAYPAHANNAQFLIDTPSPGVFIANAPYFNFE